MTTGRHYQNAYVTRNIDAALETFRERADVRLVLETEVTVELWTPKGTGTGVQKLAFVWVGDFQYELIEPKSGAVLDLFRDALPEGGGLQFHHVCHKVDDWDALWAKVRAEPWEVVLRGGTPGMLEYCYVDTRPWLGHYTEYVWMVPERWAAMGGR